MKVIAIGCDHAGYELKERLKSELTEMGHEVIDCGTDSTERVDYPDYGFAVGIKVSEGPADLGVAVCGSGFRSFPSFRACCLFSRVRTFVPKILARAAHSCN